MAFSIISADNEDYLASPPRIVLSASTVEGVDAALAFTVTESDAVYSQAPVTVLLDWKNGSAPEEFQALTGGVVSVTSSRLLPVGIHNVLVYVSNSKFPTPDTTLCQIVIDVQLSQVVAAPANFVYGPILPLDSRFPNPQQWSFHRGTDLTVLESSVKMLLSTTIGERVMLPDYGTNLRSLLFEPNVSGIESLAQHEIITALQKWEPRVKLQTISVQRNTNREVRIYLVLVSVLSGMTIESQLTYTL